MTMKFRFFPVFSAIVLGAIIAFSNCSKSLAQLFLVKTDIRSNNLKFNHAIQESNESPILTPSLTALLLDDGDVDPFSLMKDESLGKLKIDIAARQVIQLLGSPDKKSKSIIWEADGLYHQNWYYPKQGITLGMISEITEKQQRVASIKLVSPSKLKTNRGIGIGNSYNDVVRAYQKEQERENSIPFKHFVAGSIYGGLIFSFENGRITEIFLGSAAE
jgi:hypothetical protein